MQGATSLQQLHVKLMNVFDLQLLQQPGECRQPHCIIIIMIQRVYCVATGQCEIELGAEA